MVRLFEAIACTLPIGALQMQPDPGRVGLTIRLLRVVVARGERVWMGLGNGIDQQNLPGMRSRPKTFQKHPDLHPPLSIDCRIVYLVQK